jgi:hypothetical protein
MLFVAYPAANIRILMEKSYIQNGIDIATLNVLAALP